MYIEQKRLKQTESIYETVNLEVDEFVIVPAWITSYTQCEHCKFSFEEDDKTITAIRYRPKPWTSAVLFTHNGCARKMVKL